MGKEPTKARDVNVNPTNSIGRAVGVNRTKSINDLSDQMDRISAYNDSRRASVAARIYSRYLKNIGNTEENSRDRYNSNLAFYRGNAREYRRLEDAMESRQYSRRQYMGK